MSTLNYPKLISGQNVKCITRLKPYEGNEDIKVLGNNISLIDLNNRVYGEYYVSEVYQPEISNQQIYEQCVSHFTQVLLNGQSVSIFAFGSSGSGRTQIIEGSKRDSGLITLFADTLFNQVEGFKYTVNIQQKGNINYNYMVRIRYVEIIDEEIKDLFASPHAQFSDIQTVVDHEWEGPTISNGQWISVTNAQQLNDVFYNGKMRRNTSIDEFGKMSSQSAGIFTIELCQTKEFVETKENLLQISKVTFFDLPACDPLYGDSEALRIQQGSTRNKGIQSLWTLLKNLSSQGNDYVYYENSYLTRLLKDAFGGNSMSLGIFTLQMNDLQGSQITLKAQELCYKIANFPIINDQNAIGLLRKYRMEIKASSNNAQLFDNMNPNFDGQDGQTLKILELEKKIIQENIDKARQADEKAKMAQKLSELREKYNELVRAKTALQSDLIQCEEEKLEVSKALVDLQIENTRLLESMQNEKYDTHNNLLNAESDNMSKQIQLEKALEQVAQLQDGLKDIAQEKLELEIEFVALKKNFLDSQKEIETEKTKNENIGIELINLTNENKALHDEINDIYRKSGSTNDENNRFIKKIDKLDKENQQLKEALLFTKAEVERLKTEMIKFDTLEKQHQLDTDQRRIEMEQNLIMNEKKVNSELDKKAKSVRGIEDQAKLEKQQHESERMQLTQQVRMYQRKIEESDERLNELVNQLEEYRKENFQLSLQVDEMRQVYRGKLLEFLKDQQGRRELNGKDQPVFSAQLGNDINAREEFIRTYNEKEVELLDKFQKEKQQKEELKKQVKALKNYARGLKYLAEDWAPLGIDLPQILTMPMNLEDDEFYNQKTYHMSDDNLDLKKRNKRLEDEIQTLQQKLMEAMDSKGGTIQYKIQNEIEQLKGSAYLKRPGSSSVDTENLRRERNQLQEENKNLVGMLKDNRKWDNYLLLRENEQLKKKLKDFSQLDSVAPLSGDNKTLQQKMQYYEKTIQQLEKERSSLLVRATMAEEQLRNMQERLNIATQNYQKKVYETQKQNQF